MSGGRHFFFSVFFLLFLSNLVFGQENIPKNGVKDDRNITYVIQGATLHISPSQSIENGTLILKNDRIIYSGQAKAAPKGSVERAFEGAHIYPSFIDLYSSFGMPKAEKGKPSRGPQMEGTRRGPYNWNDAIRADQQAFAVFGNDPKGSEKILSTGFGIVLTSQNDGIARGTAALVALDPGSSNECIITPEAAEGFSLDKGSSKQDYPNSLLGSIALLRQTFYDAKWYQANKKNLDFDASLEALNTNSSLPKVFRAKGKHNIYRANNVGKEFGIDFLFVGSGNEYQMLRDLKGAGKGIVLPLDYPKAFDLNDPLTARNTSLTELMHWELAPANAFYLDQAGISIMFTLEGLEKQSDFLPALRKAVEYGLPRSSALKALTTAPASFLNQKDIGNLKQGSRANFFISNGDLFDSKTIINEHWINGKRKTLKQVLELEMAGEYRLKYGSRDLKTLLGEKGKNGVQCFQNDTTKVSTKGSFDDNSISFSIEFKEEGLFRFSGWKAEKDFKGNFLGPDGSGGDFTLSWTKEIDQKEKEAKEGKKPVIPSAEDLPFPFGPYGLTSMPIQEEFLISGATVWTNTEQGKVEADVWVKDGKIYKVGKDLEAPGSVMRIDGKGKHLTSGIIDEHSHIALSSVNEGGQNSSAEVRMEDVVFPESIAMYRQLSGGVTAAQLLHGSANPVGGQSAIIKFRWGSSANGLLINDADPFIKFALGENVKQSNWGDLNTVRYPQTRMGVEQVYEDLFTRAGEYENEWKSHNSLSSKSKRTALAPRKDLELEAILEIKNSKRFITCHSYVQSEINMLMKVAERYGFRINTFTHILEGYKVADIMKEHGAGGSTFSDWWAYKFEVKDAIPYNSAIMDKVGVTVAVNSDDSEMARRLNQEAAKAVKYGGVSEENAWKMITLNPAKLLHLDDRMGMVKEGYDADLVLWNNNPLSIYARAEKTYVDGRCMYSEEIDIENRAKIQAERTRLVQEMLKKKGGSGEKKGRKPERKEERIIDCESVGNFDF